MSDLRPMCLQPRSWPHGLSVVVLAVVQLGMMAPTLAAGAEASKLAYNRDIRPILAGKCFACHGSDQRQRQAGLRLDVREVAVSELKSGHRAIVPGKPQESALVARIYAARKSKRMPPARSHKTLSASEKEILKRWITEGAAYQPHWAFLAPQRPPLPPVQEARWPRNPIDDFILARLEKEGLHPSPEAERATLLRRVTLDLTGLPPTPAEADAFVADKSPDAYEKVVDRLLESPHYGEHMARFWLDAVRYADTHGLHFDNYREIWPYRDWVIKAFNANMPFDRFIVEQLAGDLLPHPTRDQLLASGYNRCNLTTNEGGTILEEAYVRNVVDRVDTTGTVFLGLTVRCGRCHDHKFDPIKQKDYYQLFAFLNSLDQKPMDDNIALPPPVVRVPSAEQAARLKQLGQEIAALQQKIAAQVAKVNYEEKGTALEPAVLPRAEFVWIDDDIPPGAKPSSDGSPNGRWHFVTKPKYPVYSGQKSVLRTASGLSQHFFEGARPGLLVGAGDTLFTYVYLDPAKPPREIMLQWNTGQWQHRAYWGENLIDWGADKTAQRRCLGPLPAKGKWVRLEVAAARVGLKPGMVINGWAFTQFGGTVYWDRAGIVTATPQGDRSFASLSAWLRVEEATRGANLPKAMQAIVALDRGKRTPDQKKQLRAYFIEHVYAKTRSTFEALHRQLAQLDKQRDQLDKQVPASLVSRELPKPRPAYILQRGEYDHKGEKVGRNTPGFLPPMPKDAPRNRLGFARWLVSPDNPLTARVAVNRFWQQYFGTGIVKTSEDFGTQGEMPSHPELIDWLAVQFQEDGWNVKKMMKRIVMSATYRQSSRSTPDRRAKDPENRLLARGPRFRLDAEMLRDQALAVSGLLVEEVGGPSVKPPQPGGLWEAVGYTTSNTARFTADKGSEKVHRRSLYTFWKRTSPPPQMSILDAPSREECVIRRERTDTPLQALLLMNERLFVEAARGLAQRTLREGGSTVDSRLTYMFKLATAHSPDAKDLAVLRAAMHDNLEEYRQNVKAAKELIAVGESRPDHALDPSELAAWTMVANLVLNLDEVLNKG